MAEPCFAWTRLGRIGRYVLDTQMIPSMRSMAPPWGPSHLRRMLLVDFASSLWREEVVAATVRVEARWNAVRDEHFQ